MMNKVAPKGIVFLVDDDLAVQRGIGALLSAADYEVQTFKSGDAFLSALSGLRLDNAVLVVDVCMPGIQGLELQKKLHGDGVNLPTIVMTAHGDIPMAVRAMQNGAIDFLQKPFTVDEIIAALNRAFDHARPRGTIPAQAAPELEARYQTLTPREQEVLSQIVNGNTNKQIAQNLSISPRTIEVHRRKIMTKMTADTFAELVRMAVALNID